MGGRFWYRRCQYQTKEEMKIIGSGTYGRITRNADGRVTKTVPSKWLHTLKKEYDILLRFTETPSVIRVHRLKGRSLTMDYGGLDLLTDPRTDMTFLASVSRQMLDAVAHIHDRMVVHLDLKMENFCVDDTGNVRLIDFGMSMIVPDTEHTITGQCGSPIYAPPEILRGTPFNGFKVDAWSTGVTLFALWTRIFPWELASLTDPFYGKFLTHFDLSATHALQRVFPTHNVVGIPTFVREAMDACLVVQPKARTLPGKEPSVDAPSSSPSPRASPCP